MAPRGSRGQTSGPLRTHSRTSSTTKLATNMQFTQKDVQQPKIVKKPVQEAHGGKASAPPFARVNNNHPVHSKEPLAQAKKLQPQHGKAKSGFTIASPSENADDDDEWVSSESGAATPSHQDSDSDTASDDDHPQTTINHLQQTSGHPVQQDFIAPPLARIETARPSDFEKHKRPQYTTSTTTPSLQPSINKSHPPIERHELDPLKECSSSDASQPSDSPKLSTKRFSRPPSTHSVSSRGEHALRPHPLIRGASHGGFDPAPKPGPLAPLTVIPDAVLPQISTSPPTSVHDDTRHFISSSPTSFRTSPGSPISNDVPAVSADNRRFSFSSAKSGSIIPVHPAIIREVPVRTHDRSRTLSTMSSTSASSAALSSLTHLPTVTRPPSPQTISFFPPVNPHANIDCIHPLLPGPYLNNHLTVLARRTPIRESFDRVIRAKYGH